MGGFNSLPIFRVDGLEPCAARNGGCIAKAVNYECPGDHNEQGGAATNERDCEPSTAGGDHDAQYRHHHGPAHAARTLRGEIQTETPAEEAVSRTNDAQIMRSGFDHVWIVAEQRQPG